MAAQKNELDYTSIIVPSRTLESLLGVKARTIRDLTDKGIVKRDTHGKYFLFESAKGYITALKVANAGKNGFSVEDSEDELSLENEKALHEHSKRLITEIKLQLIRGQVHKSEDVARVMTDMFAKFKSKMDALPAKLARKLEGKNKVEIQTVLKAEISKALAELADYKPENFYSDEHVEIPEDAITQLEDDLK